MMTRKFSRRTLVRGAVAAGATAALGHFPAPAIAQASSIKVGLLTVKTGPLAQGGVQMEQGVLTFLKDNNAMMGGRKVELFSADTGGNPARAKTKAQELVEHDKVDVILGPLATFELYAINDYIRDQKMPTFSVAAADDLTQRHPNPYLLRAGATASGAMHVLGHYAATELKLKRIVTACEDLSYGYEEMGGFQAAFAAGGGCIVNKLWPPLVTPDYTPYIAQIADCDGVCQGFAGSNPLRFMKAYAGAGLKFPVVAGMTGADDALLRSFGDEALGLVSATPLYGRLRHRRQQALRGQHAEKPRCHSRPLLGGAVHQLPGRRHRLEDARRRSQRQGQAHVDVEGSQSRRHAARAAQIRPSQQCGGKHLRAASGQGGRQIQAHALE